MKAVIEIGTHRAAIALEGPFSTADWVLAFHALLDDPSFRTGMSTLWDFHAVQGLSAVTQQDMRTILAATATRSQDRGAGHTALVMKGDLAFGLARMFEMMTEEDLLTTVRVFRDRESAEKWLSSILIDAGELIADEAD